MSDRQEQLLDLLTEEALHGLTAEERAELDRLMREFPEMQDDSLALTAAAVAMADLDQSEELPNHLSETVVREYERLYSQASPSRVMATSAGRNPGFLSPPWLGWAFAAVASALLAFNIFFSGAQESPLAVTAPPKAAPTLLEQREALIAAAGDVVRVEWAVDEKKPSGVSGDVVWSQSQQKGFMRFKGLAANDKSKETYQLWIIDEETNQKHPIDGGVFDIESTGEVVVPIDAKLRVGKALAFAVTVEKPGGVVVSKQEKVAAIAKVGA